LADVPGVAYVRSGSDVEIGIQVQVYPGIKTHVTTELRARE